MRYKHPRKAAWAIRVVVTLAFFLFLGILSLRVGSAQDIPPSLYSEMKWRMIGPFRAGKVNGVAGVPGNPAIYYMGADGGGVWKTADGGVTWKPIFDGESAPSIGALAVAPSNPNVIYAGTGVNTVYGDVTYGNGVFKSTNGGETWQHLGLEDTRHIARILVDPRNPDIVLVAALGHSYGPNEERGVFRSADGGKNWKKVLFKDNTTGAVDLCFEPGNPKIVYATLWHVVWKPDVKDQPFDPGSGLYKSKDGGITWTQITGNGLPTVNWGRAGVAVAPGMHGQRVYLLIEAKEKKDGGLFRSDDGGATWKKATEDKRITGYWYMSEIFVEPKNPDVVYVPEQNFYRSTDGGKSFTAIKGAPGGDDYHTMWIDPVNPQRMILGTDQGATITMNGAETWSSWYNQPTGEFYRVATDHRFPYWVYGPQQDSGTAGIASRGNNGQITERDWYPVGPGESGYTIPDPLDADVVYNAGPGGSVVRLSKTTGQVRDISPAPIPQGSKYRFNWTIPMVFSPQDPHLLYLGTQFLMKTSNDGTSWEEISPDLTRIRADEKDTKKRRGTILTIAPSPVREGVIWAGTDDGNIQVTKDGGKTWRNVTPPAVTEWSSVSIIEASHFDAGTAYAPVNRNNLDDLRPHILRTRDYGESWQEIVRGISEKDFSRTVREDPGRKGLLYAGTEKGVYVSFDDGEHWQSLRLNMPVVSIHDLAVEQDDLVAATYGRSFWILDDVTPLRQVNAGTASGGAHLFAPRTAIRVRRDENQDTPLPPEVPAGKNPPDGAIINYYLARDFSGDVQVEIRDEAGNLVHRYSSAPIPNEEGELPFVAEYWIAHPRPLSKLSGMHRFVWNLRYTDPPAVHEQSPYNYPIAAIVGGTSLQPEGPLVLPGKYEVQLKASGQTLRQSLEVKQDPRVHVARNELQSALDLQLKISAVLGKNYEAYQQVKQLRARLGELMKRPKDDPIAVAAKALDGKAAALEGEATPILETPKGMNLMTVNDGLTALMALVDGADFAPSEESFAAFRRVCQGWKEQLSNWEQLKNKDAQAFSSLLEKSNLPQLPSMTAVAADVSCGN
ncbi:MAG TPA: hypothetical protein VJN89_22690 [Candidatus Acidoferrum sp.]|nr:hypothetical protein [Candidatus Acidoferrum sp.]